MRDDDLERLFQAERAADARRVSSFTSVLAGNQARVQRRSVWPVFAAGTALAILFAILRITSSPAAPFELRAGDLRVPTDYLLEFATYPRAGDIPAIGSVDWFPLDDAATTAETRRQQ
jgi:hypothetical protein